MSGRFVRASSFRHVHGQAAKPEEQFQGPQVQCAGDGNFIASNGKYMAFAGKGGGGPVNILRNNQPGRIPNNMPKLEVHKAKVVDFEFSPFDTQLLATAAEDNYVKISRIPEQPLAVQSDCLTTLAGHDKKVVCINFHPTASNVLASGGFDHKVKIFDCEAGSAVLSYDDQHRDALNHIRWNYDGSMLATTAKDKMLRLFDPRDQKVVAEVEAFAGSKKASCEFITKHNMVAVVGFTKSSMRQIKLYDIRNMAQEIHSEDLDQSAGVLIPYYDHDTSMLYIAGKGDCTVKYFEIVAEAPYLHFLSAYSDNKSHKGLCFIPKTACNTQVCEVAHCLRILNDSIVPISFQVPRKNQDTFQSDIFPDTRAPIAAQTAAQYIAGGNPAPEMTSMRPGEVRGPVMTEFVAAAPKKTYEQLETELAAALAKISELEARLA